LHGDYDSTPGAPSSGQLSTRLPVADKSRTNVRNRRVDRTRAALFAAFRDLFLADTYDGVSIAAITEHANVGRSTFYEHFANKEMLLRESLTPLLAALATAVARNPDAEGIAMLVAHFAKNRRVVRAFFAGSARDVAAKYLGELIQAHLQQEPTVASLPLQLKAMQISEAQLGLIHEWLRSPESVDAMKLAAALIASSRAIARS
jgi:AcrR family transcriptional regulator